VLKLLFAQRITGSPKTTVLAYNLGNLWRRLALPRPIERYSLTSLQQRLVKTGGRLVKHARYYWLFLAEGHLNRRRFGAMLGRIALLPDSGCWSSSVLESLDRGNGTEHGAICAILVRVANRWGRSG
jgi:hypothetical protein